MHLSLIGGVGRIQRLTEKAAQIFKLSIQCRPVPHGGVASGGVVDGNGHRHGGVGDGQSRLHIGQFRLRQTKNRRHGLQQSGQPRRLPDLGSRQRGHQKQNHGADQQDDDNILAQFHDGPLHRRPPFIKMDIEGVGKADGF